MPFLGLKSRPKKAATTTVVVEGKKDVPAHPDELYAQIDSLQAEMSRLYMEVASMKAENGGRSGVDRHDDKYESPPHSQTSLPRDMTSRRSTPNSMKEKRTSPTTEIRTGSRQKNAMPPPVPEIFIQVDARKERSSDPSKLVDKKDYRESRNNKARMRHADEDREFTSLQMMEEEYPLIKRSSGKSYGSKTVSTGDLSRSTASGGSGKISSPPVHYRTVKRIVEPTEISQLKPVAEADERNLDKDSTQASLKSDLKVEYASTDDTEGHIDEWRESTNNTTPMNREWPPPQKVKEPPPPVSNMIRRMVQASEKSMKNSHRDRHDQKPWRHEPRTKILRSKYATTERIGIAPRRRPFEDIMSKICSEIQNGVTLKPTYCRDDDDDDDEDDYFGRRLRTTADPSLTPFAYPMLVHTKGYKSRKGLNTNRYREDPH